jgi:large subunit ribosomal protein L7/L12
MAAIKEMNVLEVADLVKALEEEFGISAAPVAVAAAPAAGGAPLKLTPAQTKNRPISK